MVMHWQRTRPIAPRIPPIAVHFNADKISGLVKADTIAASHQRARHRDIFADGGRCRPKTTASLQRLSPEQKALSIGLYLADPPEGLPRYPKAIDERCQQSRMQEPFPDSIYLLQRGDTQGRQSRSRRPSQQRTSQNRAGRTSASTVSIHRESASTERSPTCKP